MSSFVDVISVASAGITAISFLQGFLPSQHTQGARVQIRLSDGKDANNGEATGNPNTGGVIKAVYGFDSAGQLLGVSDTYVSIGAGNKHEFQIDQGNTEQALYINVVADDDAVCIPVIGVTQPADGLEYGWIGDVFQACGLDTYYGNVDVSGDGDFPRCGWLDANHDNIGQASFKWYLPAFSVNHGSDNYEQSNVDYYCHPRPLEVRYSADPIEARSTPRRRNLKVNELIMSPHAAHPASKLCEDPTSVGPDFVSLDEMTFCDMGTKQWYSLCDEERGLLDNCYALNVSAKSLSAQFLDGIEGLTDVFGYELVTSWELLSPGFDRVEVYIKGEEAARPKLWMPRDILDFSCVSQKEGLLEEAKSNADKIIEPEEGLDAWSLLLTCFCLDKLPPWVENKTNIPLFANAWAPGSRLGVTRFQDQIM